MYFHNIHLISDTKSQTFIKILTDSLMSEKINIQLVKYSKQRLDRDIFIYLTIVEVFKTDSL